jgi:hypothetical protein
MDITIAVGDTRLWQAGTYNYDWYIGAKVLGPWNNDDQVTNSVPSDWVTKTWNEALPFKDQCDVSLTPLRCDPLPVL